MTKGFSVYVCESLLNIVITVKIWLNIYFIYI